MSIDLLVFGPHPDDIEIGLGGTIARHAADGPSRRAVRSDGGELGEQRHAGRAAARRPTRPRAVLGAAWRENLGWPDGGIAGDAGRSIRSAVDFIRRHRPRTVAIPYWDDRHPDHVAASQVLTSAAFTSGLRRYETDARAVAARLGLLLLHQRRARRRRSSSTSRRTTSASARRSPATAASSRRPATAPSRRG